jgi:hypothetical protein
MARTRRPNYTFHAPSKGSCTSITNHGLRCPMRCSTGLPCWLTLTKRRCSSLATSIISNIAGMEMIAGTGTTYRRLGESISNIWSRMRLPAALTLLCKTSFHYINVYRRLLVRGSPTAYRMVKGIWKCEGAIHDPQRSNTAA